MDESAVIADGIHLGYKDEHLQQYVAERIAREDNRNQANLDREELMREREERRKEKDLELRIAELNIRKQEAELEASRQAISRQQNNVGGPNALFQQDSGRSVIKLTPFKDGEDVDVYLRTFDKVKEANGWTDKLSVTALMNGFLNTNVGRFIDTLPNTMNCDAVKTEIVRAFGKHIYDYQTKFHSLKQNEDNFGQYVRRLRENLLRMCTLASVNDDYDNLIEFVLKDRLLRTVDKNLVEYLKEKNVFSLPLEDVVVLAENFQAIHGRFKPRSDYKEFPKVDRKPFVYKVANYNEFKDKVFEEGNSLTCFNCNNTGHIAKYCPNRNTFKSKHNISSNYVVDKNVVKRYNSLVCYKCKQSGHTCKVCPLSKHTSQSLESGGKSERDTTVSDINVSFAYNKGPKLLAKLPIVSGKCNGKTVNVLRDTGSTAVLVKDSLIDKNILSNDCVSVQFAGKDY